jgi:HK97 family phage major capsid protein
MNQQTFALLLSQSDAMGRPLLSPMPQGQPVFTLVGRPVVIATQMPDPGPGATPIAVGDWRRAFTVVRRKAPTIQVDPFSAGYCLLYKSEARIGSGATCPNACRLLRIR